MLPFLKHVGRYVEAVKSALAMHWYRFGRWWLLGALGALLVCVLGYLALFAAPARFVPGTTVVIPPSTSVRDDAQLLASAGVIQRPLLFRLLVRVLGSDRTVQEGAYKFAYAQNAVSVAERLLHGYYGISSKRITFTEGVSVREMAQKIATVFPQITASDFIAAAQPYEGYLFPDTYTFAPSSTAQSIVQEMRTNFETKTSALQQEVASSTHSFQDVVILASLVQDEARTSESQRTIAGIIWNRIAKGMPLQIDAVFGYIYGKQTYSPSFADLGVDSPYNTYTHTGLPPGPIGNPGLSALKAAAFPTKTKYLFYLTGKDGFMHYATTYAEHLVNQKTYL